MTPFATTVTIRFHSISMRSSSEAYVAGSNGHIFRTENGGSSWTLVAATGVTLYALDVFNEIQGTAGAIAGSQVYTIVSGNVALFLCCVCHSSPFVFDIFVVYEYSPHQSAQ